MTAAKSHLDAGAIYSGQGWLEEPLAAFERAWLGGAPPPLAPFLSTNLSQDETHVLAWELVKLDMNLRAARGAHLLSLERYVEQLPVLRHAGRLPTDVIAEDFLVRRQRSENVSVPAYVARFPQQGSELRKWLLRTLREQDCESEHAAAERRLPPIPRTRFVLKRLLGSGGLARVYAAVDTELGETVAVKLLKKAFWQRREARERIEAEAEILQSLRVVGIAHYRAHGKLASAGEFLATGLISGVDLHQAFRGRRAATEQIVGIGRQLRTILEAVHAQEVIHADLKPSNVLLGNDGRITLVDFGFSVRRDRERGWNAPRGGTAAFLPPELFAVAPDIGPAADVYGFGGILLWLLTGKTPRDEWKGAGFQFRDEPLLGLCKACLQTDPTYRPHWSELRVRLDDAARS